MSGFDVKKAPAEKMDELMVPQKCILRVTRPRVFKGCWGSAGGAQRNWTALGLGRLWQSGVNTGSSWTTDLWLLKGF